LPDTDGREVVRSLRKGGFKAPIIMLTGHDTDSDTILGLESGANDYVAKPFRFAVLLARIRSLLRRAGKEHPATLHAGDLRLDPAAHRVWRGPNEVRLTARELALLEFLLQRPGDIVSKDQILEHVWGEGFEGDPNIIEVYIARLRNKLDRPFDRKTLHTVRGVGYRISSGDE